MNELGPFKNNDTQKILFCARHIPRSGFLPGIRRPAERKKRKRLQNTITCMTGEGGNVGYARALAPGFFQLSEHDFSEGACRQCRTSDIHQHHIRRSEASDILKKILCLEPVQIMQKILHDNQTFSFCRNIFDGFLNGMRFCKISRRANEFACRIMSGERLRFPIQNIRKIDFDPRERCGKRQTVWPCIEAGTGIKHRADRPFPDNAENEIVKQSGPPEHVYAGPVLLLIRKAFRKPILTNEAYSERVGDKRLRIVCRPGSECRGPQSRFHNRRHNHIAEG